jgi:uncharacterized membrane protein YfcA
LQFPLTPSLFIASILAGLLGSLTGLGGGVVIIPVLVLLFSVDMRYAIGASLVAVIATSSGSAAAYVREGFTNIRIAMLLEVATTTGALLGAILAAYTPVSTISIIFGLVLLYTALSSIRTPKPHPLDQQPDQLATRLRLNGTWPVKNSDGSTRLEPYFPRHIPAGFAIMLGAGMLSALVGIGSGIVKVFAMDRLMRLPFKVSTTTSNFMIGVTAAASAGVYFHRGQIDPRIAAPVAIGALCGSFLGAKILPHAKVKTLRVIFAIIVAIAGTQMLMKGLNTTPNP